MDINTTTTTTTTTNSHNNPAQIPSLLKQLRACLLCNLIKSFDQFIEEGCDNCEYILHLKQDSEKVLDCTTTTYSGMVGVIKPKESWVARWQRIDGAKPGLYAGKVFGRLPEGLEEDLLARGIKVPDTE